MTDTQNVIAPKTVAVHEIRECAYQMMTGRTSLLNKIVSLCDAALHRLPTQSPQLDAWIEREFSGHGRSLRRQNETPLEGEPWMSMEDAKVLTRRAVAEFATAQSPLSQEGDSFSQFRDNEGNPAFDGYQPAPGAEAVALDLEQRDWSTTSNENRHAINRALAALRSPAIPAPTQGGEARRDALEAAAQIADSFTCGACGMDGKTGAAIRALANVPAPAQGVTVTDEMVERARNILLQEIVHLRFSDQQSLVSAALEAALHPAGSER